MDRTMESPTRASLTCLFARNHGVEAIGSGTWQLCSVGTHQRCRYSCAVFVLHAELDPDTTHVSS